MIGVIAKPGQRAALEEFFELFKTPWEFFQPDRTYDVVLATADDLLGVRARVLLIYGADTRSSDSARGLLPRSRAQAATLTWGRWSVPVRSGLLTFADSSGGTPCVTSGGTPCGVKFDASNTLTTYDGWFGTAAQVVDWFRLPRAVRFERLAGNEGAVAVRYDGDGIQPPLCVRIHQASNFSNPMFTLRP